MAAIAYIDTPPEVNAHNGHFLVVATSGGEQIQLLLTTFALRGMYRRCQVADAMAETERLGFEPTPFSRKQVTA